MGMDTLLVLTLIDIDLHQTEHEGQQSSNLSNLASQPHH